MTSANVAPSARPLVSAPARVRDAVALFLLGAADQPILPVLSLFALVLLAYMDIAASNVLGPDVRATFHISNAAVAGIAGLSGFVAVIAALPIAYLGDRFSRVDLTVALALILGAASLASGLTPVFLVWFFVGARMLTGVGEVSNGPVHQSLLADFHPPRFRPRAFSLHRAGYPLGLIAGSWVAGQLGQAYNWRVAFVVLAFPAFLLALFAGFLRDPVRGTFEGLAGKVGDLPGFAVTFRRLWQIATLRRVWIGALFTAGSVPLIGTFNGLFLHDVYGFGDAQLGVIGSVTGVGLLLGLLVGGIMAQRLHRGTVKGQIFYAGIAILLSGVAVMCAALTHQRLDAGGIHVPGFWSIAFLALAQFFGGLYYPPLFQVLALVSPPRIRSTGLAGGALFLGLGALVIALMAGALGDAHGLPAALILIAIGIVVGGGVIASGVTSAYGDAVAAAQVNVVASARQAQQVAEVEGLPVLEVSRIEFAYGGNKVLFGTTMRVERGEALALLGTNGAGKSTLLKVIAGIEIPSRGAVFYEGADVTGNPPELLARQGLVLVPGGRAVFSGLTVRENLRLATWLYRRDKPATKSAIEDALQLFPRLAARVDKPAAVLSGGERQMLGVAQGLMCQPRLLMIDEMTLGLSPLVVEELVKVIGELRGKGITLILVEQSVNIASLLCERAYFMEKGRIRFEGSPHTLLNRPDLVRSIFLGGKTPITTGVAAETPA